MIKPKITLIGNLGKDWLVKEITKLNKKVYTNTICCNYKINSKQYTEWFSLEAWDKTGEILSKYTQKGSPLFLDGHPRAEAYLAKDKQEPASKLVVRVSEFSLIGNKSNNTNESIDHEEFTY